jgi:hypothetical protein
MALKAKSAPAPSGAPMSARDMTWRHYADIMDKFRKLCHGDAELFRQADARIRAKRVAEAWQAQPKGSIDPVAITKQMDELVMDAEDDRQIDTLYRRKLEFRDRLCVVLGKLPDEKWDTFFERMNQSKKVPGVARQFELMGAA